MKILITCDDISTFGGIERVVANLSNAFSQMGHEVIVYAFSNKNATPAFAFLPNILLHCGNYQAINFKKPKNFLEKIVREILRIPAQVVAFFKVLKRDVKLHYFVRQIQPDVILSNEYGNSNKVLHVKHSLKIIHGPFWAYEKFNLDAYAPIILIASQEQERFKAKYPKGKFCVIPNFLPEIPQTCTNYAQKVVLSIGRMDDHQKGFLRLITIWNLIHKDSNFKEWKLHIIGDGILKAQIQESIQSLNLRDSIVLKPFTQNIESEYLSASVYVMSSHFEGFGMVLAEASSYGLPCMAFDIIAGPREIIENGRSGFLIEDNALEDFAARLKILMRDATLREAMGREAKGIAQQRFSKEVVMQRWLELFESMKKSS